MSERHVQRVHTQPVVLDIGEDRGALIIFTPEAHADQEIEISPRATPERRTHQDVAERRVHGRTLYAAVFSSLPAGDYWIWGPDPARPTQVRITGGAVAAVDWRLP